ncbi:protein eyes shut [Epargyreus clarus]|uniref:protein eyes shut n=1 Tax=Epargyreus clarus TaxID=520877 RepID=UPI003C2EE67C
MSCEESSGFRLAWWLLLMVPAVTAGIACLANPCLHGICIDDINSTYSCYCIDGYTGVQCQTNWDECWSDPCQNGGTCIDGVATYNCSCPDGFIGDNCETNYNECESNPCLNNGTCIDMTNEYICHCSPGFSGEHCEVDVAVCNSTEEIRCYNGGECIEGPGFKFYCKCLPGWTGPKCEDQIDECESNPCENGGICIDVHADYMCACTYGYTGKSCEVQIEFCDVNSCSNDALCVVEDGIRMCYCVPDFHGERCELQYDECLLGPRCMNGGTCIDGVDNFTCSCPPSLTGALCECLILDDSTYDCDYVSPTPFFNATQSTSTTLTDLTSESPTSTTTDIDVLTTVQSTIISSTTESTKQGSTEISISTETTKISSSNETITSTTELTISSTGSGETITESTTAVIVTLPTQPHQSIATENSKTETTTECSDVCIKSNVSTDKFPVSKDYDTTTSLHETTTKPYVITYPTVKKPTEVIPITTETLSTTTVIETDEGLSTVKTNVPTDTVTEPSVELPKETTTQKIDTTTEIMFTDTPTDQSSIGLPTLPSFPITDSTSPGLDITTYTYTTVPSECTSSVCNNHGTCITGLHGTRCHCLFNYGGRFCEEKISITSAAFSGNSYIGHHLKNTTSIDIEFNAKTLITDGQMMYVNIAKGVYMELYMNMGLLKFKFSCGYQTMLLSELKTFVNKGYLMKIETRLDLYLKEQHCNATLRLNDTVAMSGGQVANISSLDHNSTLYFGNAPNTNHSENKPFVGCIRDLMVNGEKREVFGEAFDANDVSECSSLACLSGPCLNGGSCSDRGDNYVCSCANGWMGEHCNQSVCDHNPCHSGGSCVRHPGSGFLCLCPYGKHGIFCEYNVEITRPSLAPISSGVSSYVMYPLSPMALNSDRFDLRLRFQTADMDQIALLAFVGQNGRHDSRSPHLALTFVKGYIMLTWNMGSGPRRIFTSRPLSYRRGGHAVRAWRRGRSAGLSVDGRHNVSGNAPAHHTKMNVLPYIYIGGHSSQDFQSLPHDLPLHSGWRGCIWEVGGQAVGPGKALGGRGVGQCGVAQCTAKSCNAPRGVCIHSPATYGCICNEGWFGATCASRQSPCDQSVSQCRGRCVITADGAQCDCPYGKTGEHCDQDLLPIDILFSGIRSFIKLHRRSISSVSLSLEAEIKPTKERGLIMFIETPHFYSALSLQGSLLEYRWTDRLSGLTSLVRSGVVVSLAQWHAVRAGRYGARLYVWVDGALSTEPMLAHAYPHTASLAAVALGGAKDLASLPFDVISGPLESYAGCLRNFHINNVPLALEPQNIEEGQNVFACEGAACGAEGAAGAAAAGGARCRRGACTARCVPPAGRCRAARCVCAAGRAGPHCEQHINITVPQFDGSALVRAARARGPRLRSAARARLALRLSTAEPDGLVAWIALDTGFVGVGLEDGYLRVAWSLPCDDHKPLKTRNSSKLLPQAGFMADGEWHALVLNLKGENITLTCDQSLIYHEQPCLNNLPQHEDVGMYIGGVGIESSGVKMVFPQNFKGCIDQISTSEDTYLTDFSNVYSENIKSCQWFPST